MFTPWSRVLPEKLKRPGLLKKFPAFYGTQRFIMNTIVILFYSREKHVAFIEHNLKILL
jgi:hypothetical protein